MVTAFPDKEITMSRLHEINWLDKNAETVDGFTVGEIEYFLIDSVVTARCSDCDCEHEVEPDAEDYDCQGCGALGTVTSPLIKLGLA